MPFSELFRMQQVQVLTVESWVLPVGVTQWVSLKDLLTSGGTVIAETVTPGRQVPTGPGQPVSGRAPATHQVGGENPHASPTTQVRKDIVQNPTGGLNRLTVKKVMLSLIVAFVLLIIAVVLISHRTIPHSQEQVKKPATVQEILKAAEEAGRKNPAGSNS